MLKVGYDSPLTSLRAKQDKWQKRQKDGSPSKPDVVFVVMNALVNVLADEVLHCHENGDCQEPDDLHPERSRVWSELLQSSDGCQSERSHVWSELHCCQDEDEDEVQVIGCPMRPGCLSPLVFASGDRVKSDAQESDTVAQLLSLALHPDPASRWKVKDTTIKKITLLQCNVSLLVPLRTPRFDTPACHPHHAL